MQNYVCCFQKKKTKRKGCYFDFRSIIRCGILSKCVQVIEVRGNNVCEIHVRNCADVYAHCKE